MPELPPIRLPEKPTDRRLAAFSTTSSTLVDPRSNASPRNQAIASQGASSSSNVDSPTLRGQSQVTSPAQDGNWSAQSAAWDQRRNSAAGQESGAANRGGADAGPASGRNQDYTSPHANASATQQPDYWRTDGQYNQQYGGYDSPGGVRGKPGTTDPQGNYYQDRYDSYPANYQQWQGSGQSRSYDAKRHEKYGYDSQPSTGGDWSSRERGHDSWQRDYYPGQYDNNEQTYRGDYSNQRSNYDNYAGDYGEQNRSWGDHKGSSSQYGSAPNRGRGKQWK